MLIFTLYILLDNDRRAVETSFKNFTVNLYCKMLRIICKITNIPKAWKHALERVENSATQFQILTNPKFFCAFRNTDNIFVPRPNFSTRFRLLKGKIFSTKELLSIWIDWITICKRTFLNSESLLDKIKGILCKTSVYLRKNWARKAFQASNAPSIFFL